MATPIDKGKFRSESQLARSIYSDLAKAQDAREKPPTKDPYQGALEYERRGVFVRKPTGTGRR
jgi:hypothetical protein